ncbi:MAG: alanine racemase [Coriobacteriia bacterium]|nr:alanine racemase [Coriobacteriia bacterium]
MTAHRDAWVEIDLGALQANVRTFCELIGPRTQFMAVVKADAYGHGAIRCATAALEAGATWLGVATADEALELRAAGDVAAATPPALATPATRGGAATLADVPILVFAEVPETALAELIEAHVDLCASSLRFLKAASREAARLGQTARFHLKVDTGMHRIGVAPDEAARVLLEIEDLPGLQLAGVFTHFATADVEGDWDAGVQLRRFEAALAAIRNTGIDIPLVHAANSAAAVLIPEARYDMVRVGISLYGLYASEDTPRHIKLHPVMSVKARTTLVKTIATGEGVSYGLTWRAPKPTRIATLPLGYADGMPRRLSNRLEFLLERNGRRIDQAGRICMDQLMAEIPAGEQVEAGDTFIIIGQANVAANDLYRAHTNAITVEQYAKAADSIEHEITIGFGRRLEKIYL